LLENTFRSVNIALVNELAMLCDRMHLDVWEVIDAAATKPYGFMPFYPGPGVGGHCIPVDPYYLAWKAREFDFHTRFIELAAETNLAMPFFTVGRIRKMLDNGGKSLRGARVLALGAAFKRDIDDARQSPAVRVMEILSDQGADLQYHDPYVPSVRLEVPLFADGQGLSIQSVALDDETLRRADCVVILVAHSGVDYGRVVRLAPRVFDAVNATRGLARNEHVERL
jgi:UDP-N-acetyl-D-glucosamine dehydrogenase